MKVSKSKPHSTQVVRQDQPSSAPEPEASPTDLEELVRVADILKLFKVSRSTLWRWVRNGQLCRPVRLSANVIAWRRSSVADFLKRKENG
jgi:predicted DNA-binding transcriptional regulator AlpA